MNNNSTMTLVSYLFSGMNSREQLVYQYTRMHARTHACTLYMLHTLQRWIQDF